MSRRGSCLTGTRRLRTLPCPTACSHRSGGPNRSGVDPSGRALPLSSPVRLRRAPISSRSCACKAAPSAASDIGEPTMLLGVVADDFTGASDIANTIAKGLPGEGGLATAQFLGVPREQAPPSLEAGVVALKSRSIAADEAIAQSLAALTWLLQQGCRQVVFKYCSTFDSTPGGNIGP